MGGGLAVEDGMVWCGVVWERKPKTSIKSFSP